MTLEIHVAHTKYDKITPDRKRGRLWLLAIAIELTFAVSRFIRQQPRMDTISICSRSAIGDRRLVGFGEIGSGSQISYRVLYAGRKS